jgi:hypothetical protein
MPKGDCAPAIGRQGGAHGTPPCATWCLWSAESSPVRSVRSVRPVPSSSGWWWFILRYGGGGDVAVVHRRKRMMWEALQTHDGNTLTHALLSHRPSCRRQHRLLSSLRPSNGGQLGFRRVLSLAPTLRSSQGACPVASVLERPCAPALCFSSFHAPSKLPLLFQNVSSFRAPRDACNLMM